MVPARRRGSGFVSRGEFPGAPGGGGLAHFMQVLAYMPKQPANMPGRGFSSL